MPIQFTCSGCGQVLRVGDDAAGKRARCPKCQTLLAIPSPEPPPLESSFPADDWSPFGEVPLAGESANPYLAPALPRYQPTGAASSSPFGEGKIVNVPVDIGSIVNYAIQLWKENLGLLVGAVLVMRGIGVILSQGSDVVMSILMRSGQREVAIGFGLITMVASILIESFLRVGYTQMMLKMARRQRVEFTDLFGGGPLLLPAVGVSLLFGIATAIGCLLLIVPGVIVVLVFWPCYYLVVDGKAGVLESFGLAREISANNYGTTFLIGLIYLGIIGLGLAACCVGVIVAAPLASLLVVAGYLMMSGQVPLNPRVD